MSKTKADKINDLIDRIIKLDRIHGSPHINVPALAEALKSAVGGLDTIACWHEGVEVDGTFEPTSAKASREALLLIFKIIKATDEGTDCHKHPVQKIN